MDRVQQMRLFIKIAELRSFRRAAQEHGVSYAASSRCVAQLETRLGSDLIDRTTRSVSLTECGERYLIACRTWIESLSNLEAALPRSDVALHGSLNILSSGNHTVHLSNVIGRFRNQHPGVSVNLTMLERPIDCLQDKFHVAIATEVVNPQPRYCIKPVSSVPFVIVANHIYLSKNGTPQYPNELLAHRFLCEAQVSNSAGVTFRDADCRATTIHLAPVYVVNSAAALRLAALSGMGFAIIPEPLVAYDIKCAMLHRLCPDFVVGAEEVTVKVAYRLEDSLIPKVDAFVNALRSAIQGDVFGEAEYSFLKSEQSHNG